MSNVVTTTCQDCIWAEFSSGTQTGCKFGRLDKFRERGVEVKLNIESEDVGLITAPNNFYTIERFCNRCRNIEWSDRYDYPYNKCIEQSQVQFDIVVPIDKQVDLNDIKRVFGNLLRDGAKINSVHFAFTEGVPIQQYLIHLNEYFADICPVFYTQVSNLRTKDKGKLINEAFPKFTGMYYLVIDIDEHKEIPTFWADLVDSWVNTELYPLIMVKPNVEDSYNGLLVHRRVHSSFGGNTGKTIQQKIEEMIIKSKEEDDDNAGIENAVKCWEDDDE